MLILDFPGSQVVGNSPTNAGDMDSIPGLGRCHVPQIPSLPCELQLLSPNTTTRRACALQQEKPPRQEAYALQQMVAPGCCS